MTKRKLLNLLTLLLIVFILVYDHFRDGELLDASVSLLYFGILIAFVWYKVPEGPAFGWPYWMTTRQIWLAYIGEILAIISCVFVLQGVWSEYWWIHLIYLPVCIGGSMLYRYAYTANGPKDHKARYNDLLDSQLHDTPYVTVAEFEDVESARLVRDMLIARGIEARTFYEVIPAYISRRNQPVCVCVRKADKSVAEKIINE